MANLGENILPVNLRILTQCGYFELIDLPILIQIAFLQMAHNIPDIEICIASWERSIKIRILSPEVVISVKWVGAK